MVRSSSQVSASGRSWQQLQLIAFGVAGRTAPVAKLTEIVRLVFLGDGRCGESVLGL